MKDYNSLSYHGTSKEVDVSVSPVVVGRVDGAGHTGEALGDETRVTSSVCVFRKDLIVLAVILPILSSCTTTHPFIPSNAIML